MVTWRSVREFPDYEISDEGGLRRVTPSRGTQVGRVRKPQFLNGYVAYWLKRDGHVLARYAHRMVADAFLGPIPRGMQVNHKNGDRSDCRLDNLEIVTNAENRAHSYQVLGVKPNRATAERNCNTNLTWPDVDEIRSSNELASQIAKRFNTTRQAIWRIRTGKAWRDEDRPATP